MQLLRRRRYRIDIASPSSNITMSNHLISIVLLGFCIGGILAWSQQPHITISKQIRTRHQRMILLSSNDDDTDKEGENKLFQDNTKEESSFGVSYIGGGKIHMFILSMHIMCSFSYLLISLLSLKTLVDQSIMMIHLMLQIISNQGYRTI